jgi:hypothetical protein
VHEFQAVPANSAELFGDASNLLSWLTPYLAYADEQS